jgi:hypothetical protein
MLWDEHKLQGIFLKFRMGKIQLMIAGNHAEHPDQADDLH